MVPPQCLQQINFDFFPPIEKLDLSKSGFSIFNKKQSYLTATLFGAQNFSREATSYARGTTLAACKPLGPSSMENSTFCSASSFRYPSL